MTAQTKAKSSDAAAKRRPVLAELDQVVLKSELQEMLDEAYEDCGGAPVWRGRKRAEARELVALSQVASRITVEQLDLRDALRAVIHIRTPVACLPDQNGPLELEEHAILGLTYYEKALHEALPGYAFVQILMPRPCWSASISYDVAQALCLGKSLPAGVRVKELVLMSYGALTMQTTQINLLDPAGVMNPVAALWWQANGHRVPLSHEPFLTDADRPPKE